MVVMMLLGASRFLLAMSKETREGIPFPARVRVMNILWTLAYFLTTICFLQFQQSGEQIMNFGNALLAFIEDSRSEELSM
jgi:hypothetical protein